MNKFYDLYNLVMENISKNDVSHIKSSASKFINNLKQNHNIKDTLNKNENLEVDLSNKIEKITKKSLNLSFLDNLKVFLNNKNIPYSLFEVNFLQKYDNDIEIFIDKIFNEKIEMLEIKECHGKNIEETIASFYEVSPNFVNALMIFSHQDKGIGVGPGELGLSFFIKNASLSKDKGDIVIDGNKIEVKASQGRIPDVFPHPALCRKAGISIINKYINYYKNILINKELIDEFNSNKWLSLYGSKPSYENLTKKLLSKQFMIQDDNKKINKIKILKEILLSIFNVYGESAKEIINSIDLFVNDDFNIDVDILKNITMKSFMEYYKNKEQFDKIIFYKTNKKIIYLADPDDPETYKNLVGFPSFGDAESTIRNHTVLTAK